MAVSSYDRDTTHNFWLSQADSCRYLDKVTYHDHASARMDYEKLVQKMADPDELLRAYYYHCMPYQSNPAAEDEKRRYASKHRFVTALSQLPRFEVCLGRLKFKRTTADGERIFVQKRIDNMIGVDMTGKGKITNVSLFTGDSDYIPSVEAVKREGVLVTLWHGSNSRDTRPDRELVAICDERQELSREIVAKIRRHL